MNKADKQKWMQMLWQSYNEGVGGFVHARVGRNVPSKRLQKLIDKLLKANNDLNVFIQQTVQKNNIPTPDDRDTYRDIENEEWHCIS